MNKSHLVDALKKDMNISGQDASVIVGVILNVMTSTLEKGESIDIRGFGSLVVKQYDSYTGRHPRTGQQIMVKPKKLPLFRSGKELLRAVNNGNK